MLTSVMSFNIRYDNLGDGKNRWELRRPGCARLCSTSTPPDVVGVQEALHHQVEQLAEDLPEYAWVGVGRTDGLEAGEYARGLLPQSGLQSRGLGHILVERNA